MNDKSRPADELIADLFHDHGSREPLHILAQRAAAHARSRRQVRRSLALAAATVGIVGLLLMLAARPSELAAETPPLAHRAPRLRNNFRRRVPRPVARQPRACVNRSRRHPKNRAA
ncbi:MAG: hypothetical protein H7343_02750 [Undibacterium sp.]|nr:hypothetical protein [Opitutaceae bacterium]